MFSLFSRQERIRRARLWRENSPSPAEEAVASFKVRSPKSAVFGGGKSHDRFLEAWFSLFLRESVKVSHSPYPQKFTLSALARATSRTRSENAHAAF